MISQKMAIEYLHQCSWFFSNFDTSSLQSLGSSGSLFSALSFKDKKKYAIKTLNHQENIKKMLREVHILSLLNDCSNIIKIDNFYNDSLKNQIIFSMEVGTGSLSDLINKNNGKLDPALTLQIALDCINGLLYAKKKHFAHKNLKPKNIICFEGINRDLIPDLQTDIVKNKNIIFKLSDWGANLARPDATRGISESITYTPGYAAPEVIDYEMKEISSYKVDMYSLGMTLLTCCGIASNKFKHLSYIYILNPIGFNEELEEILKTLDKKYKCLNIIFKRMLTYEAERRITLIELKKLIILIKMEENINVKKNNTVMPRPPTGLKYELYVGDLDERINEATLERFFQGYGRIYSIIIMRHPQKHTSKGFGYVVFYDGNDALRALKEANHTQILNNPIRVTLKKKFREIPKEANIFLKNIDKSINVRDLTKILTEKYGPVFTSKISYDENGNNRNYGYVQFEKTESSNKLLKEGTIEINGTKINVARFLPKGGRQDERKNNLYLKNLPIRKKNQNKEEYEYHIKDNIVKESKVDPTKVKSILVQEDKNRYFCFICFENYVDANEALNNFKDRDIFNCGLNIYADFAQKKEERERKLKEQNVGFINKTNVYIKNLVKDVTKKALRSAFSVFGNITSSKVQQPSIANIPTAFAFINFETAQGATNAISQAKNTPAIAKLFVGEPYVTYHKNRARKPEIRRYEVPVPKPAQSEIHSNQLTVASLKERLPDFLGLSEDKQREILGNLLFPLIQKHTDEVTAPKITGMLIDFSVFEVADILEFLDNESVLKERIDEAKELIQSKA